MVHRRFDLLALLFSVAMASCTDAPAAPESRAPAAIELAPRITLQTVGQASATADALSRAFDRVDRFRLVLTRTEGETVVDISIAVEPGAPIFHLDAEVLAYPGEPFQALLTAFGGQTELFAARPFTVRAPGSLTGRLGSVTATPDVVFEYSGPGSDADAIDLDQPGVVLAPGASGVLTATLRTPGGPLPAGQAGVPLVWSTTDPSVATVSDAGTVQATGPGTTSISVATPNGLSAAVPLYVVAGEIAFVQRGAIRVGPVAGLGSAAVAGAAGGATDPAWIPGLGGGLVFSREGVVHRAGVGVIGPGRYPAPTLDGTKLATVSEGGLLILNADGSASEGGPAGDDPHWLDERRILVASNGIDRVDAATGERTRLVDDVGARHPSPVGQEIGFLSSDGSVRITTPSGSRILFPDARSDDRPAFSPDGFWVVFSIGGRLHLGPVSGGVALPLHHEGSRGAWGSGEVGGVPPTVPDISGVEPARPIPGQSLLVRVTGLDELIRSNNRVLFPTRAGDQPVEIEEYLSEGVRVTAPQDLVSGLLRVRNFSGEDSFVIAPALASIEVSARTTQGAPVSNVTLQVLDGEGNLVDEGSTDGEGALTLDDLPTGPVSLGWLAPEGFEFTAAPPSIVTLEAEELRSIEVALVPQIQQVRVSGELPVLRVGAEPTEISIELVDAQGNAIPGDYEIVWRTLSGSLGVEGSGRTARLSGIHPSGSEGAARVEIEVDGKKFLLSTTVLSSIGGRVTAAEGGGALPGVRVILRLPNGVEVEESTDADGRFGFEDLFAGPHRVRVIPPDGFGPPAPLDRTLGPSTPRVTDADFALATPESPGAVQGVVLDGVTDAPLDGATVELLVPGSGAVAATTVGTDGAFRFGELAPGLYDVRASADGYDPATVFGIEVVAGETVVLETFRLVPPGQGEGSFSGRVLHSQTGSGISSATLDLRSGSGNTEGDPIATTQSGGDGSYQFGPLPTGTYTVTAQAFGFIDAARTVVVLPDQTLSGEDIILSPSGIANQPIRIELTWGAQGGNEPENLDAYLTGPDGQGGAFLIGPNNPGSLDTEPFAAHEGDDTSFEGPEVIRIEQLHPGVYTYFVHNRSDAANEQSRQLAQSAALVRVFRGNQVIAEFAPPNEAGTVWTVFEINGGGVVPVNTISFVPPDQF